MSQSSQKNRQPQDDYYMMLAIEQAKKGLYTTRPNPAVGCVIVKEAKQVQNIERHIVGQGFHPKAGQPHAEIFALREAGTQAQGATAYVTLEPCSHTGRTPPCALALIGAGVKRVVIAGLDPNPKVAGRGVALLQEAGIEVTIGVATSQAEALNKGFLTAMRTGKPYVRLKIATSLDGRTAMASGESQWITGPAAREDVQRLRALSGAIITGSQTIIDDNPTLNVRSPQLGVPIEQIPQPLIVVLDRRGRLTRHLNSRVISESSTTPRSYTVLQNAHTLVSGANDLEALLEDLFQTHHVHDVLIEAGATVAGSFVEANLVDELIVYQAPCLLGHHGKPMLHLNIDRLSEQRRWNLISQQTFGVDNRLIFSAYK